MTCPKCNAEIGEEKKCPTCGYEVAEVQANEQAEVPATEAPVEKAAPQKAKAKTKLTTPIIAVVALLLVASLFFVLKGSKKDDGFVQRSLYFKENAMYYLDPKTNEPILITDKFFDDEDESIDDLIIMNSIEFKQKGNTVFYSEKADLETSSFSLYYKKLNKPNEEPVKLAEDVMAYVVNEKGTLVIYRNTDGDLYKHDMTERTKIISETDDLWFSEDCTKILYLVEDGGLYIQDIEGEKDKIDADVTNVYLTDDNFENIYYFKEDVLYLKRAETEKVKVDKEVARIVKACDNGTVYYTKENEDKGEGTLIDYIKYPAKMETNDEKLMDDYYYDDWRARNEAINRIWAKEVLEETEVNTVSSLYYFDGESADLVNDSYVEYEDISNAGTALIISSYDNVDIKKIDMTDFIDALDKKHKFRKDEEKGIFLSKSEYQNLSYFDEFKKIILGTLETDATKYIVVDGKQIEIETDSISRCFTINDSANTVYYIDKFDAEKNIGELRVAKIKDGAVVSTEVYDTEVSSNGVVSFINDTDIIYTKNNKDGKYDLYLNKELVEYDIGDHSIQNNGREILYYTEYDDDKYIGTLSIYTDGKKTKIAEEVYSADVLENGDVLYITNYSEKNEKGDLYIYADETSTRIDYDVSKVFTTPSDYGLGFNFNYIFSWDVYWDYLD